MRSLKDYVNTVAVGMGRFLNDNQLTFLAKELAASKKYREVLSQLELRIKEVDKGNLPPLERSFFCIRISAHSERLDDRLPWWVVYLFYMFK